MPLPSPPVVHPVTRATLVGFSCLVLAVLIGTFLGLDWLARNQWMAGRIQSWDLRRFENNVEHFMNRGNFIDFEDRLIVEELPMADYSKGGSYFFGTSALKWGLKTWELPAQQRRFVGNYGIGATSHQLQLQWIRFLAEQGGLLQAGGDKVQVVLGAYYSMGTDWAPDGFFGQLWARHHMYSYDPSTGIQALRLSPLQLSIRKAKTRCSGFVSGNVNRLARFLTTSVGVRLSSTEKMSQPERIRNYVQTMAEGPNRQEQLSRQMASLSETIDYLKKRQVHVSVVLVPTRRAFFDFPYPVTYRDQVKVLCARDSVECVDLSNLLDEDQFWDINHSDFRGLDKTHKAMMEVIRPHLRRNGLWP